VAAAACVTVNVRLPIESEPARAVSVFAATENATLPLPVPLAPETIASHGTMLEADHEQPAAVETAMGVPAPPPAATDCDVGVMEIEQFPA